MGHFIHDYNGWTSSAFSQPWAEPEKPFSQPRPKSEYLENHYINYNDMGVKKSSLEDVMLEFQLNGSDSPYEPDDGFSPPVGELSGLGPSAQYVRQMSCPERARAPVPAPRPPRPRSLYETRARWDDSFATSTPILGESPPPPHFPESVNAALSAEQVRVLGSLPDSLLQALLRTVAPKRNKPPQECRFCKNNGERVSFFRSHALKDGAGRVACPVLRAFVCRRCGARGDSAHTLKYCPLTTREERIKSEGMMHSLRTSSCRRRNSVAPSTADSSDYFMFGEPTPSVVHDQNYGDLDPLWAAVEQKLSLY